MKVFVFLVLLCGVARAHPLDTGYLRVETAGTTLAITFDIDVALAAQQLKVEPGALDAVVGPRATELATSLYRTAAPIAGEPCIWGTASATRKGATVTMLDSATCKGSEVRWDLSFGLRIASTFQILGKVIDGAGEHVISIDKHTTGLVISATNETTLGTAVKHGIEHVGLLPSAWHGLPEGLECLLLGLLLLLAGGGLQAQLSRTWMLVIGHAIGLSIAGVLPVPPIVGAGMLMLGIAAISGSLVTGKLPRQRWMFAGLAGGGYGITTIAFAGHPIGFLIGFAIAQLALTILLGSVVGIVLTREELAKRNVPIVPIAAIVLGAGAIYGVVRWL